MRYGFRVRQGPKTIARVSFNDLPAFREASRDFRDTGRAADHLLVPGENVMRLEVWEGPPSLDSPEVQGIVDVTISDAETETALARIAWPALAMSMGQTHGQLEFPFSHTERFEIPLDHPKPIYDEQPPEIIPERGTPDLRAALERLHGTLDKQDARGFVSESRLKLDENRRFYGASDDNAPEGVTRAYEGRFSRKLRVEPLDDELIRFESRAKGRVAYATRTDGRPVIHAEVVADPGQAFSSNPLFVKQAGVWTLFL